MLGRRQDSLRRIKPRWGKIHPMKRTLLLLVVLSLLAAACGTAMPALTPSVVFSPTASSTVTAFPSEIPTPPTPTPALAAIPGALTVRVNVRSGPGTTYESLGQLEAGTAVRVSLLSRDGNWYRILHPSAPDGFGWVAAQYVRLEAGAEVPQEAAPTPAGPTGRVLQRLNVRSGPGLTFETLGILERDTMVVLVAKNATASWFQVEYPPGTDGRAWVSVQYIQTDAAASLPAVDEYGNPIRTGTPGPSPIPMTPTPTVGPAIEDGDSPTDPALRIAFSPGGTRRFTYSSQVSAPDGDVEDWLEFTPFASLPGAEARLSLSLACTGNAGLTVELWRAGAPLPAWGPLECGSRALPLMLAAGAAYQVRILVAPGDGPRLVQYSLSVENLPYSG